MIFEQVQTVKDAYREPLFLPAKLDTARMKLPANVRVM